MRSQASAVSKPPPIATRLTAAMIGLSQSKRVVSPANPPLSQPRFSARRLPFQVVAGAERLVTGPVTIATHCSGSAEKSSKHPVELEMRVDMQGVVHFGGATASRS